MTDFHNQPGATGGRDSHDRRNDADDPDSVEARRDRLIDAMLDEAAFTGWTRDALRAASDAAGLAPGSDALLAPGGPLAVIEAWSARCDRAAADAVADADLSAMRVRDRVTFAVRARVEAIGSNRREAARRAALRLAAPDAAPRGAAMVWRTSDTIWRALNDPSTDGNFYSKRAILSGVIANVTSVWIGAEDAQDAWDALDRRIDNVMSFETFKGRMRGLTADAPDLVGMLSRLRYPGRRR